MKKIIFLAVLCCSFFTATTSTAQTESADKHTVLAYIKKATPAIINCCSSYPKEIESSYISHRTLRNGRLLIEMSVTWTSDTATNCHYKIQGELTVDQNGCYPNWLYKDSSKNLGCFIRPGCRWTCGTHFSECL